MSVDDLIVVVVVLQLREDVIGVPAAEVTEAGVDPHDLPGEHGPVGTHKLHVDGLGLVGNAAAIVCGHAHPTVFRPVRLLTDTARDCEVFWLFFSVDVQTLLPWLRGHRSTWVRINK